MKIATLGFALLLGLPGLAAAADAPDSSAPAAPTCLTDSSINRTVILSDQEILFYMNSGKIWKNTLQRTCYGLKNGGSITCEINGGAICANLQTLYARERYAPCFLGKFTAYVKPAKPAAP